MTERNQPITSPWAQGLVGVGWRRRRRARAGPDDDERQDGERPDGQLAGSQARLVRECGGGHVAGPRVGGLACRPPGGVYCLTDRASGDRKARAPRCWGAASNARYSVAMVEEMGTPIPEGQNR